MNKIKIFLSNKSSSIAYAAMTAIFTIVPEDVFTHGLIYVNWDISKIVIANRLLTCSIILLIVKVIYTIYLRYNNSVTISNKNYTIKIEYGDILEIDDGKKVINFDECYTTKVGEQPEDIKSHSLCGQYLKKYPISNMQHLIATSGIRSSGSSKFRSKASYTPGTIILHGNFMLMAFAKLDKNGLGRLTYVEYVECLRNLWKQIDIYHGTDDVYLPILGSNITRFDRELTQQELLDIMLGSYRLSASKLKKPCTLHIVCQRRIGFSINNVFGLN